MNLPEAPKAPEKKKTRVDHMSEHFDSLIAYVSEMDKLAEHCDKLIEENRRLEEYVTKSLTISGSSIDKVFDEYCGPNAFPYLRNLLKKELGLK